MKKNNAGKPIRIADIIGGHIHPAVCVPSSNKILVVHNREGGGGKELLLNSSRDGGLTWSKSSALPKISSCSIYPGSLTTLSNKQIVLNWSCYRKAAGKSWRTPQFCISMDEGETWSEPQDYPITDHTNWTCLRHSVAELSANTWVCPFYDRTVIYNLRNNQMTPFGDGRNHGMVPIVRTHKGTIISGAPQANAPVPVGVPGNIVRGLRSTDGGRSWDVLGAFPHFGVAGYDLTVLTQDWIVLTSIVYGIGHDGEFSYELIVSRDDGKTWYSDSPCEIYNPRRRIGGRGWPRTVQITPNTLGTVFYDLDSDQAGGPGLFIVQTPLLGLETAMEN